MYPVGTLVRDRMYPDLTGAVSDVTDRGLLVVRWANGYTVIEDPTHVEPREPVDQAGLQRVLEEVFRADLADLPADLRNAVIRYQGIRT